MSEPTFLASRTGRFRSHAAAAAQLDTHLAQSIEQFATPKTESEPTMRGMQRLAHLTQTAIADMDSKADAIADRIVAGQARASAVIDKFGALASSIEQTADVVEAALAQISNDPSQGSGGSQ